MNTLGLCGSLVLAVVFIAFLAKQDAKATNRKNYDELNETEK